MTDNPTLVMACPGCGCEVGLYNIAAAAAYLDLSESGLKYHIGRGHIRPFKTNERAAFFTKRQLDKFDPEPPGRSTRFVYETPHETKES